MTGKNHNYRTSQVLLRNQFPNSRRRACFYMEWHSICCLSQDIDMTLLSNSTMSFSVEKPRAGLALGFLALKGQRKRKKDMLLQNDYKIKLESQAFNGRYY